MAKQWPAPPEMQIDPSKTYHATLKTNKGDVRIELLTGEAPKTVNNFVFLAREGYYDGVKFHRVIRTFMIQTGDPTGTGAGGPGYRFADELPPKHSYEPGMVAMANAGPNTNGSQFFICSGPDAGNLNRYPNYTQFGRVVEGMETVQKLASTPVGPTGRGETSKPLEEILIENVTIEEA
jgi:cyclophilin family peptidyl-prolyl cis-trans isomerase